MQYSSVGMENGMKKNIAILLSAAITASLLPVNSVYAESAGELIVNGSFEEVGKYDFPIGWESAGENLVVNGDFETGNLSAGKDLTGTKNLSYTKDGKTSGIEVVKNTNAPEEFGEYALKIKWNEKNWGAAAVKDDTNGVMPIAYNSEYIARVDAKAGKDADFPTETERFQFHFIPNYIAKATNKKDFTVDDKSWILTTEWQNFTKKFTTIKAEEAVEAIAPRMNRYLIRTRTSATSDAVLYVDNYRIEKLGRATKDKVYRGSRSLKYVGYDDNADEDWRSEIIELTSGSEYELTYYSHGDGAYAYIEDASGKKIGFTEENSESEDEWVKTTARFIANGDAKVCLSGGLNTVYFDDVSLKEIIKPASVKLEAENSQTYVKKGNTLRLTASVYDKYDNVMPDENVSYVIAESDIDAQISADGELSVGEEAVLGSYVTVVATVISDDTLKDEIKLLICGEESMPVTVEVMGDKKLPTVTDGKYTKKTYTATVKDQYDDIVTEGVNIKWAVVEDGTTTENIVISENGEVSVLEDAKAGTLIISATAEKDGITAVSNGFEIVITQSVEGIRFEVGGVSAEEGGERAVKLIFKPENAENKNFTVKSSDENIFKAVKTADGVSVTAVSKGEAVITATSEDGGYEAKLIATTADNAAAGIDTDFENGASGWNVNVLNLISNGDFEKVAEWETAGAANNTASSGYVSKEKEPENVYEGNQSAYVSYGPEVTSKNWSAFRIKTLKKKLMPGSLYHLAMALKLPTVEEGQRAALSFKISDDLGNVIVKEGVTPLDIGTATDGWEFMEAEYRIPENGTEFSIPAARTDGQYGFNAYFDNLTFETIAGVTEADAYKGTGAMRIGAYGGVYGEEYQTVSSDLIEIEASSVYNATVMVKSLDETAKAGIAIEYLDRDKKVIKTAKSEPTYYSEWKETSVAFTAPENARYIRIILISDGVGINVFDSVGVVKEAAYPDSVDIRGASVIAIPEGNEKVRSYEALVLDRFGETMADETAILELVAAPSGVALDGNSLKISKSAAAGDITLRAEYGDFEKKMTVKLINVTSFEIQGLPENVVRGVDKQVFDIKTVIGIDSAKTELGSSEVEYSIIDSDDEIYIVDSQLVVESTAKLGEFRVKATYKEDSDVFTEESVTVKKKSLSGTGGTGGSSGSSGSGGFGGGVSHISGTPAAPSEVDEPTSTIKMNNPATITDVSENHWAYKAINTFAKSGIVSGRGDNKFEPDGIITRSEFLKILVSVFGFETSYEIISFTDTVETGWYYPYVSTAVANNIAFGYPDGSFGINTPVTREEMAVFIERAMAVNNTKLNEAENTGEFPDADQISPFAANAVAKMKGAGIISGDENGMFNPKNNATRAEAVWMLYKIYSMN